MQEDLSDARATVDWAIAQLPILADRIRHWGQARPYGVVIDLDSEPGKKVYRLSHVDQIPVMVRVETGIVLHAIRSGLDLLASTLASRAGYHGNESTHFPISADLATFRDKGLKQIKRLSTADQAVIESLGPYKGGHPHLFSLHRLDIKRKHRALLGADILPRGVSVLGLQSHIRDVVSFPEVWNGFKSEAVVARTAAALPDAEFSFGLNVVFQDSVPLTGHEVVGSLKQFACTVNSIIDLFE